MLILVPTESEARALFDGPCPTAEVAVATRIQGQPVRAALCGFGPVAAGVLGALTLAAERPTACVLGGIGGTLDPKRLPVGAVLAATSVTMAHVGRDQGLLHLGPSDLGIPQVPARDGAEAVYERLDLPAPAGEDVVPGPLLTVPWAAASPVQAEERRYRHPEPLAEDMEGFGVALAARRLGVPLTILRAISNVVGAPRASWDVSGALAALRRALRQRVGARK